MDGVTILQVIETASRPDWVAGVILICVMAGLLFGVCSVVSFNAYEPTAGIMCLIVAVISIALIIILLQAVPKIPETTYRVLVDDSVNMNAFFSKYKLIRTEGLIYVVKLIN